MIISVDPIVAARANFLTSGIRAVVGLVRERCAEDHVEARGSCSTGAKKIIRFGARWSMAAIEDSVGGVEHFRREA